MMWWRRRRRGIACQELVELVTAYLDGVLSRTDRVRFEAHIAGCDDCSTYVEQFEQTVRALGATPGEQRDPAELEVLMTVFRGWAAERGAGPPQSGA
jgi:anti-sigma factor RsiW